MAVSVITAVPTARLSGVLDDDDLVAAVRRGDDVAFEELYARYAPRISAYVRRAVRDAGRTEDVVQEVFVAALRRMRATEQGIAFKPWIYEIAKNACIDHFRRAARAEEVSFDVEMPLAAAGADRETSQARWASCGTLAPEAAVDQKQSLDDLRGAFGGLNETHHRILVLRELEGLSYEEIGERLGMTRSAVESTLFRARRRLSEEYEEIATGSRCARVRETVDAMAVGKLGTRDRRKFAKHVAHCQPCRRHALRAGVGAPSAPSGAGAWVAGVLPLPEVLRRRLVGGDSVGSAVAAGPSGSAMGQWGAQLSAFVDPALAGWAKAAAAAAAVAVGAGAGAGGVERLGLDGLRSPASVTEALDAVRGDRAPASARLAPAPEVVRSVTIPAAAVAPSPRPAGAARPPRREAPARAVAAPRPAAPAPAGAPVPPVGAALPGALAEDAAELAVDSATGSSERVRTRLTRRLRALAEAALAAAPVDGAVDAVEEAPARVEPVVEGVAAPVGEVTGEAPPATAVLGLG